jgi:hypothetical protein
MMYKVKYECDLLGNHKAQEIELCDVQTIIFSDQLKALIFIQECTSPITREGEICPWIANNKIIFAQNRSIAMPFSSIQAEIANIHLVLNGKDFKKLIK